MDQSQPSTSSTAPKSGVNVINLVPQKKAPTLKTVEDRTNEFVKELWINWQAACPWVTCPRQKQALRKAFCFEEGHRIKRLTKSTWHLGKYTAAGTAVGGIVGGIAGGAAGGGVGMAYGYYGGDWANGVKLAKTGLACGAAAGGGLGGLVGTGIGYACSAISWEDWVDRQPEFQNKLKNKALEALEQELKQLFADKKKPDVIAEMYTTHTGLVVDKPCEAFDGRLYGKIELKPDEEGRVSLAEGVVVSANARSQWSEKALGIRVLLVARKRFLLKRLKEKYADTMLPTSYQPLRDGIAALIAQLNKKETALRGQFSQKVEELREFSRQFQSSHKLDRLVRKYEKSIEPNGDFPVVMTSWFGLKRKICIHVAQSWLSNLDVSQKKEPQLEQGRLILSHLEFNQQMTISATKVGSIIAGLQKLLQPIEGKKTLLERIFDCYRPQPLDAKTPQWKETEIEALKHLYQQVLQPKSRIRKQVGLLLQFAKLDIHPIQECAITLESINTWVVFNCGSNKPHWFDEVGILQHLARTEGTPTCPTCCGKGQLKSDPNTRSNRSQYYTKDIAAQRLSKQHAQWFLDPVLEEEDLNLDGTSANLFDAAEAEKGKEPVESVR